MEQAAVATDFPVQATLRVRGSLWKRMKIEAIKRGVTVATLAEAAFEQVLTPEQSAARRAKDGK